MARIRSRIGRAAAAHRRAAAIVTAADSALGGYPPRPDPPPPDPSARQLRHLAARLAATATRLAPGWLGTPLDGGLPLPRLGGHPSPQFVRVGVARPLAEVSFPVVVPLGHVAFDVAAGADPRVAGVLRALLLRLLAAAPTGTLLVLAVDPAGVVAAPFRTLARAGVMPPPARDRAGLEGLLTEAERWTRDPAPGRTLLLVVAGWPEDTLARDADRVVALASAPRGPRLLVAGWPPAPAVRGRPLPDATHIAVRAGYARVGHPPGGSPATGTPRGVEPTPGLHPRVVLDPAPGAELVGRVCAVLAGPPLARPRRSRPGQAHRAGGTGDPAGLAVVVGHADGTPVTLRLGGATWHWLIGGAPGSGKSALLHRIASDLAARYGPGQLAIHLLDPVGDRSADLVEAVPHLHAAGVGNTDRVRAGLREVAAEAARRPRPEHVLCLLDGWHALAHDQAYAVLCTLARGGRDRGIHLVLAGEGVPPPELAVHCQVRIALPGGQVLDPANDAATGLAPGNAVVNTAGGLGGPRGATRAHERTVRVADQYAGRTL